MVTELCCYQTSLAMLLVRQNFSRLVFSIHEVASTYTNVCVTKGLWIFMDQKIVSVFVKG